MDQPEVPAQPESSKPSNPSNPSGSDTNAPETLPVGGAEAMAPIQPPRDIRCPSCGRVFSDAKKFCPFCGKSRKELRKVQDDNQILREVRRETESGWNKISTMAAFYGVLLAANFVVAWILSDVKHWWPMLAADLVLILVSIIYGTAERKLLCGQFTPTVPLTRLLAFSGLALGTFGLTVACNFLATWILGLTDYPETAQGLERLEDAAVPLAVLVVSICMVPGIFEEIFFRGLIQGTLETLMTSKEAWLAQAVIFAIAHVNPLGFFTYLVMMGLVLGWLRNRTKSLLPGILVHFSHNLLAVLSDRYGWLPF